MNKMCSCCGESLPIGSFRQIAEKYHHHCKYCETHRFCSYCGRDRLLADFPESTGKPVTVCSECEAWKAEHLKTEDTKIEIAYNGF